MRDGYGLFSESGRIMSLFTYDFRGGTLLPIDSRISRARCFAFDCFAITTSSHLTFFFPSTIFPLERSVCICIFEPVPVFIDPSRFRYRYRYQFRFTLRSWSWFDRTYPSMDPLKVKVKVASSGGLLS